MSSDSEPRSGRGREPRAGAAGDGLALLITVFNPLEAEIIVAKLRSAGIESYVKHEALSVVYGLLVDGAGQQDIMVRADELAEARAALESEDLVDS